MINIAIRATYYIFCCRNRNWDSPDLMQFWFLFFLLLLPFFFNHPISSSIFKLPIRSEIYNCTFKNLNKVSIIIIINFYCNLREGHSFVTVPLESATPNKKSSSSSYHYYYCWYSSSSSSFYFYCNILGSRLLVFCTCAEH